MQILVGIDAADDFGARGSYVGHVRLLVQLRVKGWNRAQPMSDTTVKGRVTPSSHQVTMSVEAGTSTRLPLSG